MNDKEEAIIKDYNNNISMRDIIKKYHISNRGIIKILIYFGIPKRPHIMRNKEKKRIGRKNKWSVV